MAYIYNDEDNAPMSEEMLPTAKNCHERCRFSKECFILYQCKGEHNPNYPWECAIYDKLMDRWMEAESVRKELLPFTDDYEGEELDDESDS